MRCRLPKCDHFRLTSVKTQRQILIVYLPFIADPVIVINYNNNPIIGIENSTQGTFQENLNVVF